MGVYFILAGLLIVAGFGVLVAYKEDHARTP
jgi:hypothetical protein